MLVMSLVVLGIFSFRDLGVDLFPEGRSGDGDRRVQLPGASPDEMATAVVEPMEEALSSISGIDEMLAQRISEGSANITVEFVLERDINDAANDVREKVSGAMRDVPPQMLPPVITKVDPDSDPVMAIVVSSDTMSLRTLTEIADKQVKRGDRGGQRRRPGRSRRRPGPRDPHRRRHREAELVRPVDRAGPGRDRRARTSRFPAARSNRASPSCCCARWGASTRPKSSTTSSSRRRTARRSASRDIGYAEDTTERPRQAVWLGGSPAVMLDIRRATGENTIAVIEGVKAKLEQVRKTLPKEVTVTITRDDSKFIYAVDRLARGAPGLGQLLRRRWS